MALALAIVGRPNVGKSTLFNRLAGRKLAIVDDQPGVTRDRREAPGRLGDMVLRLIDTAGFEDVSDQSLEARMRVQTEAAIRLADVCLFVVDAKDGITTLDERFAEVLRKADRPVVLALNKAESAIEPSVLADAYALGLGEPIEISGAHGEGMADLHVAIAGAAPDDVAQTDAPDEDASEARALEAVDEEDEDAEFVTEADQLAARERPIRLAVVGRPNAGKSTLINALLNEDRLLTGPEAGITRDSIEVAWSWQGREVRLVDTAGMRKRAKVHETLERASVGDSVRSIRFADVVAVVMDHDEAFERQDLQIADLVVREGRALIYVAAKMDLSDDPGAMLKGLTEKAQRLLPQAKGTPVVGLSAVTGRGLDRLMPAVAKAYDDWNARVRTRDLNDWMRYMAEKKAPPAVDGRRPRLRYIAQVKARPPTFVLIASRAELIGDGYKRYLINGLREAFDIPGVPIRLVVRRKKDNPYAP